MAIDKEQMMQQICAKIFKNIIQRFEYIQQYLIDSQCKDLRTGVM